MMRPEVVAFLKRWSDTLIGGALAIWGATLLPKYGYLLPSLGALLLAFGLLFALNGWRRNRFSRASEGPGVVQIVEGQIGFFGPEGGGFVALDDLSELWLSADGEIWRLKTLQQNWTEIPRGARAAEQLLDEFARLPGLNIGRLLRAIETSPSVTAQLVWSRGPKSINSSLRALT